MKFELPDVEIEMVVEFDRHMDGGVELDGEGSMARRNSLERCVSNVDRRRPFGMTPHLNVRESVLPAAGAGAGAGRAEARRPIVCLLIFLLSERVSH